MQKQHCNKHNLFTPQGHCIEISQTPQGYVSKSRLLQARRLKTRKQCANTVEREMHCKLTQNLAWVQYYKLMRKATIEKFSRPNPKMEFLALPLMNRWGRSR